jgi:hypothetical protein
MAYEIPQQLEYKEKIIFGLTFKQLAYLFLFAPLILLVFFKTSWHIVIQVIIGTNFLALAIGFILTPFVIDSYAWLVAICMIEGLFLVILTSIGWKKYKKYGRGV